MSDTILNEYEKLVDLIAELRTEIMESEVDETSAYYPSFMAFPESILEWAITYFKNKKIEPLTADDIKSVIIPELENFILFEFTLEEPDSRLYYSIDGNSILVQDELVIHDWPNFKSELRNNPEKFLNLVLVNKMFHTIKNNNIKYR